MDKKFFFVAPLLALAGCGSEYSPKDLEISGSGAFVERGSDSLIDGTFFFEKVTGESLEVEFDDGLPSGDVEMHNEKGEVVLRTSFATKKTQGRGGVGFLNEVLSDSNNLSTNDYLQLFTEFSVYDGDFYQISRGKKKEGTYQDGNKIGRWTTHCENGQLESEQTLKQFGKGDESDIRTIDEEKLFTCDGGILLSATRDGQSRLQGEYIENYSASAFFSKDEAKEDAKPSPKYLRKYKDGEFHGEQKSYDRDGQLSLHVNYANGVKVGEEKQYYRDGKIKLLSTYANGLKDGKEQVYASQLNYQTKENVHWLSEVKNYTQGKLNGPYQSADSLGRILKSGNYQNDEPIGIWSESNYLQNSKILTDYDKSNFIIDKVKGFKEACYLPENKWQKIDWSNRSFDLSNCEYYVEQDLVDINKKLDLNPAAEFKKSNAWSYPAILANHSVYEYMKLHGLETAVSDRLGRTRLHICIDELRKNSRRSTKCSAEQAISYIDDVDINSVSNVGTVLHKLSTKTSYKSKQKLAAEKRQELEIAQALIAKGANINQLNNKGLSPLMAALQAGNYELAELILDAGASVNNLDIEGKSALGHFFITARNKWRKTKVDEDGTRILAKMIALGLDTKKPVFNNKTVQDFSEENNSLSHLQTLKNANALADNYRDSLQSKFLQRKELKESVKGVDSADPESFIATSDSLDSLASQGSNSFQAVEPTQQAAEEQATNSGVEISTSESVVDELTSSNSGEINEILKDQASFLVNQANEHIANFRLKTPKTNSALGSLEQLRKIDPDNVNIKIIEEGIGKKYLSLASKKIDSGQRSAAQSHLNSAKEFITDSGVIADYQARVNATKKPTAAPQPTKPNSPIESAKAAPLSCDPEVRFAGIPLIGGQKFTAQQMLPLQSNVVIDKALKAAQKNYQNVKKTKGKITFEQASSGRPIKITLTTKAIGNATQLIVQAKTPTGVVLTKAGYKTAFCDLLASF